MNKPRLGVFASGTTTGGGSGFENLVIKSREIDPATGVPIMNAGIVVVISNHEHGGVRERAKRLGIPFVYFPPPYTAERYREILKPYDFGFIALSGWLKMALGLDPRTTINIHPGPLPDFGGVKMYGHHVHEAVLAAYKKGAIDCSAVTMHFVTNEYDGGPVFFEHPVEIRPDDTAETLAARVNAVEHYWQPIITDMVVHGLIHWDGKDPSSLRGQVLYH